MRIFIYLGIIGLFIYLLLNEEQQNHCALYFKNKSEEAIQLAVVYQNTDSVWVLNSQIAIAPNDSILIDTVIHRNYFYTAKSESYEWGAEDKIVTGNDSTEYHLKKNEIFEECMNNSYFTLSLTSDEE